MTKRGKKVTYQELAMAVKCAATWIEYAIVDVPSDKAQISRLVNLAKRLKASKGRKKA